MPLNFPMFQEVETNETQDQLLISSGRQSSDRQQESSQYNFISLADILKLHRLQKSSNQT